MKQNKGLLEWLKWQSAYLPQYKRREGGRERREEGGREEGRILVNIPRAHPDGISRSLIPSAMSSPHLFCQGRS
jgi:hypothetical protein